MTLGSECRRPRGRVGVELTSQVGIWGGQPFLLQCLVLALWLLFFSVKCEPTMAPQFSVDSWFTSSQEQHRLLGGSERRRLIAQRDGLSEALRLARCWAHSCFSCRTFCLQPRQDTGACLWAPTLLDRVLTVTLDQFPV